MAESFAIDGSEMLALAEGMFFLREPFYFSICCKVVE